MPIGDQQMPFPQYDYCMNLGGFLMFEQNGNRIAFDISPVNTVLNFALIRWIWIMMIRARATGTCNHLLNGIKQMKRRTKTRESVSR
jgi:hypothetical protein